MKDSVLINKKREEEEVASKLTRLDEPRHCLIIGILKFSSVSNKYGSSANVANMDWERETECI